MLERVSCQQNNAPSLQIGSILLLRYRELCYAVVGSPLGGDKCQPKQ